MTSAEKRTLVRVGAGILLLIALIWLMSALESVTTMVMVAFFLAYILDPPVQRLASAGLGRPLAVGLILFLGMSVFVGLMIVLVPAALAEISSFVALVPNYAFKFRDLFLQVMQKLDWTLPNDWEATAPVIIEKLRELIPRVADPARRIISSVYHSTFSILATTVQVLLIPVIAYYLLMSFEDIKRGIADLIPPYTREPVMQKLSEIDRLLSAFVRGQLTVALIMAVLYSVGFLIVGIDLAIVLGIICGILWIIPYLGTIVAFLVGSAMALAKFGDLVHVIYVGIVIVVIQLFESYVLTPRVVGKALGLHPIVYILALLVGASLFGFVGMLVAIPVTAVLKVLVMSAVAAYRNSYLYNDPKGEKSGKNR